MKNVIVKKIMMAALAGTLCFGTAVAAYAAPMGGERGGKMEQRMDGGRPADEMNDERPELPEGVEEGERPELPEGVEEGERPELPEGVEEGERPEFPEGVEDGERPELPEGAEEGDRPEKPECEDREPMELPEGAVNIMAYKDALNSIEDDDTKSELQSYIDALEDALEAERSALDSEDDLTDDEIASYRDAVKEAEEALTAAYEGAGVEVSDEMPKPEDGDRDELPEGEAGNRSHDMENAGDASDTADNEDQSTWNGSTMRNRLGSGDSQDVAASDAAVSADSENNTTSGWQKVVKWFKNLFKK
ncbi:MAG: hypothetical protein IJT96_04080 [Lachnospiraceae bacterium]|nr:hypothetical protein [Lachnospiraceae bacterium]